MSKNNTKKAVIATVKYAGFEFPGLKLPDGKYAIAVPQIVDLLKQDENGFCPRKNYASQNFKRILGKRFRPQKTSTVLDNAKINAIDIETFGLLMVQIAIKGNKVALAITEASVTSTIEQAFDVAFDNKKEIEDYVTRVEVRVNNILTRRVLTDAIANYILDNRENLSDNYIKWIEKNCSDAVNKIVFGRSAKKLREAWNCRSVREMMTIEEQVIITNLERLASTLITDEGFEPLSAVKEAGNRMLIKKIDR